MMEVEYMPLVGRPEKNRGWRMPRLLSAPTHNIVTKVSDSPAKVTEELVQMVDDA